MEDEKPGEPQIVVLDQGYYLAKASNWMLVHDKQEDAYKTNEDKDAVLLGIYEFILNIIEYWAAHPALHTMPIRNYTKNMPTLFDVLFEF